LFKKIVYLLLAAYPGGVWSRDDHGWLPLHISCIYNAPFPVVKLLVDVYPEAVDLMTFKGKTPVDLCLNVGKGNERVITFLKSLSRVTSTTNTIYRYEESR